jgi:hypothetical protein
MAEIYLIPFKGFPVPKFHDLACPHCNKWKMYEAKLGGIRGFKCAGPATECGKFTSREQVKHFIGQMMVQG